MTGGLKDSPGFYIHHSPQIPLPLISPFDVLVPVQVSRAERVVRDHEEQDRRTGSAGGNDHSGYFGFGLFLAAQDKDSPAQKLDCRSLYISKARFFQLAHGDQWERRASFWLEPI